MFGVEQYECKIVQFCVIEAKKGWKQEKKTKNQRKQDRYDINHSNPKPKNTFEICPS